MSALARLSSARTDLRAGVTSRPGAAPRRPSRGAGGPSSSGPRLRAACARRCARAQSQPGAHAGTRKRGGPPAQIARSPPRDPRAKRAPLKRTLETLEKSIAKLNKQRDDIEARLADPEIYSDPAINVADLQREKVRLEREIAHAEHEWLVAQEAYEAA